MITNSLRWRIQAWHALLLTLVITGFGLTAHRFAVASRLKSIDDGLQSHLAQLGIAAPPPDRAGPPPPDRRPPQRAAIPGQIEADGAYYAVWNGDGSLQMRSTRFPAHLDRPSRNGVDDLTVTETIGDERVVHRRTGSGRILLVGRSIEAARAEWRRLGWFFAAAGAGVLALGLLGGGWVASRAIQPIAAIRETAEQIALGDLSRRIPVPRSDDELGRLAAVLNDTFARLDAAFARQTRFTADAAHELRTPVTTILTHVQNGLAGTDSETNPEARLAFEACQRAARTMRHLIDALLDLARADAGEDPVRRDPCDLAEITREVAGILDVDDTEGKPEIELHLAPSPCSGDEIRLAQVVTNLLANALEHARRRVTITTTSDSGTAVLRIRDDGPGIAGEHLPHLFDRFYRADPSRSGSSRHAGLGLAIVKAIVEAHGGSVEVSSDPGDGTTFTVRLPASSPSA